MNTKQWFFMSLVIAPQVRNFSNTGKISSGCVVNTLEDIPKKDVISERAKRILSIAMIVLAAMIIAAGVSLFLIATVAPYLVAVPLLVQLVGMVVMPIIVGLPLLLGGVFGLREIRMIRLTQKLIKRDEVTLKLLTERKFTQIPIKHFLGYLNRLHKESRKIHFITNCRNVGELNTVFCGDIHSDIRVRNCNTETIKRLSQGKDRVYVESNTGLVAKTMLDTTQLPTTLTYESWDNSPTRPYSWCEAIYKIGTVLDGIIKLGQRKWQDISVYEYLEDGFEMLCLEYPLLKPTQNGQKGSSISERAKVFVERVCEFTKNLRRQRNEWIVNTFLHRQNHMVSVLKMDEKKPYENGAFTFLSSGKAHVIQDSNQLEPTFGKYLLSSGRKFLVMSPSSKKKTQQEQVVLPSPSGGEMIINDFLSIKNQLMSVSGLLKLLDVREKVLRQVVK